MARGLMRGGRWLRWPRVRRAARLFWSRNARSKGLYQEGRIGRDQNFTGIDSALRTARDADIHIGHDRIERPKPRPTRRESLETLGTVGPRFASGNFEESSS